MITIGYVHPGELTHKTHMSIVRMHNLEGIHEIAVQSGPLISRARNDVMGAFVNGLPDSDHLLFVDTDVDFYPNDVAKLLADDLPIVSGLVVRMHADGHTGPIVKVKRIDGGKGLTDLEWKDIPKSGILPVIGVGMAFVLIRREVCEALWEAKQDKLLWPFEELEEEGVVYGEDITMCMRARALGFQSYIDVDCPIGHIKSGTLMPPGKGRV